MDSDVVPGSRTGSSSWLLRRVLLAHGVITAVAGCVLIVRPAAIPASVGIQLTRDTYLLSYLLGAAELALATMSFLGARLTDVGGVRAIVLGFIVLHGATALLEAVVLVERPSAILLGNLVARIVVVALFAWLLPRHNASGEPLSRQDVKHGSLRRS